MSTTFGPIPVREFQGERWCSLAHMGVARIDVVAFKVKTIDENYSFIGGHRHRQIRFWDSIHFRISTDVTYNIEQVKPAGDVPMRRHNKGRK